jgi:hypothetical protein
MFDGLLHSAHRPTPLRTFHLAWQLQRIEEAFGGALTNPSASSFTPGLWDREPGLDNASGLLNAARRQFRTSPRVGR